MKLESKPLKMIVEADLQDLIDNEVKEGKMIEYKRDMIGNSRENKKEFCKDVSSFANDSGGHLFLGIDEEQGFATRLSGLGVANTDAEISRLEQIIGEGIDPKIPGLEIASVKLVMQDPSVVIVIRIPKSFALPHRIKAHDVFYARSSTGKYALDIPQIRNLFSLSEVAIERLRNFRSDRISKILSGDTPISIDINPKTVLHIVPLSMSNPSVKSDLAQFSREPEKLSAIKTAGQSLRYNFDGIVTYSTERESPEYTQIFHNGAIEAVWTGTLISRNIGRNIASLAFQENIIVAVRNFLNIESYYLGVEPPFYVMLTLIGVKGCTMIVNPRDFPLGEIPYGNPIDRDPLVLPEIMIDSFSTDIIRATKSIFDALWNAAGWPESRYLP
jgi:hypothetical protein